MRDAERDRLHRAIHARLHRKEYIKDLAERAGLSRTTIYSWTAGPIDPEWESLRGIATALGMRIWELVREIEVDPSEISTRGGAR